MPDHDALLAAIRANPEDDTPRLVFADWLDENEPDSKPRKGKAAAPSSWAALIRAECEFARLQSDGSAEAAVCDFFSEDDARVLELVRWERFLPGVGRRVELGRTVDRVRSRANKAAHRDLPKTTGARWVGYTHRGFPGGMSVNDCERVSPRVAVLAAACPPLRIDFPHLAHVPTKEFAVSGVLKWCREIVVSGAHVDFVLALSNEPDAARVRTLRCAFGSEYNATDTIARALAESPNWSGLRELAFEYGSPPSAEIAERLFGAKHLHRLMKFDATADRWTADTLAGLNHFTELRELRLRQSGLDDRAAVRLANMPGLANLRYLDLSDNNITGTGATALLASRHLKNLAVLRLMRSPVRGLERSALANAPVGGLRVLDLFACRLSVLDVAALASSPRASELVSLNVSHNGLSESVVPRLVRGFGAHAPAVLSLEWAGINTAGAEALANWPAAEQIDVLHLYGNYLTTAGARALAGSAHLRQLKRLTTHVCHAAARKALKDRFGARVDV